MLYHITEFRKIHPELIPICIKQNCNKTSQYIGRYNSETGHPIFRKYCSSCHNKRRKHYQLLMKTYDPITAPICMVPGCEERGTLLGTDESGELKHSSLCIDHNFSRPYLIYRKKYCENIDSRLGFKCTTTILDPNWQLEVDHLNENHADNREENLHTLCACCHRIKTKYYRQGNVEALDKMMEHIKKSK